MLDVSDAALIARALALEDTRTIGELAACLDLAGGPNALWHAGAETFAGILDPPRVAQLEAILTLAGRLVAPPMPTAPIEDAAAVAAYFRPRLAMDAVESFWVLCLDTRGHPLSATRIAIGTLTACLVHPREVFATALRARAASIILVHNHPSGDPLPSDEDEELTQRFADAGLILGIPVLDHVIVARAGYRSLGLVPSNGPGGA